MRKRTTCSSRAIRASAAARSKSRGAAVAEVALLGARGRAQRLELVRGLERGIGEVARDQRVDRRRIAVEPLGLPPRPHAARVAAERAERGPLVPGDAEPGEILEDPARGLVGGARLVGVLDPQQEAAALPRERPVVERRARAADVEVTGRGRGEAGDRAGGHGGANRSWSILGAP